MSTGPDQRLPLAVGIVVAFAVSIAIWCLILAAVIAWAIEL